MFVFHVNIMVKRGFFFYQYFAWFIHIICNYISLSILVWYFFCIIVLIIVRRQYGGKLTNYLSVCQFALPEWRLNLDTFPNFLFFYSCVCCRWCVRMLCGWWVGHEVMSAMCGKQWVMSAMCVWWAVSDVCCVCCRCCVYFTCGLGDWVCPALCS